MSSENILLDRALSVQGPGYGYLHLGGVYGDCVATTALGYRAAAPSMPASASVPSFGQSGVLRPHPRRYSQNAFGTSLSPVHGPSDGGTGANVYCMLPLDTVRAARTHGKSGSDFSAREWVLGA